MSASETAQNQYAITRERVDCLAETFVRPTNYVQRVVEQVAFLPEGGQKWTRTLQTVIPETAQPRDRSWRIVSLGQYARRRFPDFVVTDATKNRLNLLTRHQHGVTLGRVTLFQRVYGLPEEQRLELDQEVARRIYGKLRELLYSFFTTAGDIAIPPENIESIYQLLELYSLSSDALERIASAFAYNFPLALTYMQLLERVGVPPNETGGWLDKFANDIRQAANATRYLCWVKAEPGEVLNLQVSYSTSDPLRQLGRGTLVERLHTLWQGIAEPRSTRWKIWADWYRQFGLAPLNYSFPVPSHRHSGSYYFTLEPPAQTDVTYLDWELDNSLETKEIDCSARSAHIHNDDPSDSLAPSSGGTIRAYLHCSPQDHKLIVGAALLNCAFVLLIAVGRVPSKIGAPGQSVILAAPSIFVAYLARQQKHYFADAMRRQRGILWWYLGISVVFLVTVTFSKREAALGSEGFGWYAISITGFWGICSAAVAAWYFPLGNSYERVTESLAKRKIAGVRKAEELRSLESLESALRESRLVYVRLLHALPIVRSIYSRLLRHRLEILDSWKCYQRAVREYSSNIVRFIAVASASMFAVLILFWHHPPKHRIVTKLAAHTVQDTRTVTLATWPSTDCKGCNIEFARYRSVDQASR